MTKQFEKTLRQVSGELLASVVKDEMASFAEWVDENGYTFTWVDDNGNQCWENKKDKFYLPSKELVEKYLESK